MTTYNDWVANLQSRGFRTTSLSGNEANFSDYGNALSDNLKAQVMQNGQNKELQAKVAALFGGKSVLQYGELESKCRQMGLTYSLKYEKTSYIADEKSVGTKGAKKVTSGSVGIITITCPTSGQKMTIVDSNGNAAIEIEEVFLNEILSGVTSDIAAAGYYLNDQKIDGIITITAFGCGPDSLMIERMARKSKKFNKPILNLTVDEHTGEAGFITRVEAFCDMLFRRKRAQASKEEVLGGYKLKSSNIAELAQEKWIALYSSNPEDYTPEYINKQIANEIGSIYQGAVAGIAEQSGKIANDQYLVQMGMLIEQIGTLGEQVSKLNTEVKDLTVSLLGNMSQAKMPTFDIDGYAALQGVMDTPLTNTKQYNEILTSYSQNALYSQQQIGTSQTSLYDDVTLQILNGNGSAANIATDYQDKLELEKQLLELESIL
ncbi:hypothetical protein tpqmel_0379 [Candidatus Gastranaerophilus sp. (ex Termes propinquus)]|nr:hypothetical protein tpqmel_0379 [Candidatus Gastranaerophilus sp. (ex Termes propinquus)]